VTRGWRRGLGSALYVNDLDAIPFVHSARTPVECRHRCTASPSSFRNQRIVRGAPEDPVLRQRRNEPSMLCRREHEERPWKAIREPVADGVPTCSVRRRQTREHRVSLQGAVRHEARAPLDGAASGLVTLVPRGEGRHRDARVDCNQRRIRSSVARTCSAVSLGNRCPGTATRPRPRRASLIGVAAASISSRPSAIVTSTACPAPRPRASRSGFGTTTRPAASMVVLMAFAYHPRPRATSEPRPRSACPTAVWMAHRRQQPAGPVLRQDGSRSSERSLDKRTFVRVRRSA
jgi:hypothetical protein